MRETWVRLRQHMITGFLFIMPVLITLAVLGRFWKDLLRVGGVFSPAHPGWPRPGRRRSRASRGRISSYWEMACRLGP